MPAVSFLKASEYQDGHPGYSDPLDEQTFLVNTINQIQQSKDWKSTAIVVTYDDSDGWYDHQPPVIVNGSNTSLDQPICSSAPIRLDSIPVRCGYSQRLPLLVISPWTRANHVSGKLTNTSSITRFIEDNWLGGNADRRRLLRRDLGSSRRAVLLLRAALPAGHPRPGHRRGRQELTQRRAAATVPTVAAVSVCGHRRPGMPPTVGSMKP